MRTSVPASSVLAAGLLVAPLASAPATATTPQVLAGWTTIASYCSPSGDICYGIREKNDKIQFRLSAFAKYFDTVDFCVKKRHTRNWVCNERDLKRSGPTYLAKIRWQGNYPTGGDAKRVVRFMKGSPKLSFQP